MDRLRSPFSNRNNSVHEEKRRADFKGLTNKASTQDRWNKQAQTKTSQSARNVHPNCMTPGLAVYVLHPRSHMWVKGHIVGQVRRPDNSISVETAGEVIVVSCDKVVFQGSDQKLIDVNDLTSISPLTTPAVLDCLETRYERQRIYTAAGSTLIVINPFKQCTHLYDNDVIDEYSRTSTGSACPPHVYRQAQAAFLGLNSDLGNDSHSLIVSGESGAGKTVSAKYLMKYLVVVANRNISSCQDVGSRIEQRILESNPILEAFGNASTLRNHNSSRFGKYIQLHFNKLCQIEGATIQTYLLEKTRVTHQDPGEYNFHVFYQLLQATDEPLIAELLGSNSQSIETFRLAQQSGRDTATDKQHWTEVRKAFKHLAFSELTQTNIFKILCALLHLGNIKICPDTDDGELAVISPDSDKHVQMACSILGIDADKLEQTLSYKRITASHRRRQSVFYKPCTPEQANRRTECLIKLLYATLFQWLVDMINKSITAPQTPKTISILDIYGFESFQDNSLEQLCINYANERLQQHYIVHFLKDLQMEYAREAIPWTFTEFKDNRQCLDMLEAPTGLFALLDEECQLNRPSVAEDLCGRIVSVLSTTSYLQRAKRSSVHFVIKHYAGSVQYNISRFVEKNKDDIPPEVIELMQQSSEQFLVSLFSDVEAMLPSSGKKKKCVLAKFKSSLDCLMTVLESTEPHYIRCIKPNNQCTPGLFDQPYVLSQLEACGIVETVQISNQAFAARFGYEDFLQRYGLLLHASLPGERGSANLDQNKINLAREDKENELLFEPLDLLYRKQLNMSDKQKRSTTPKKKLRRRADQHNAMVFSEAVAGLSSADHTRKLSASIMCLILGTDHKEQLTCSQFGKTKIFLRSDQLEKLESHRARVLSANAFTIQCAWRRYKARQYRLKVKAVTVIQAAFRSWKLRHELKCQHEAAIKIQRAYRNQIQRRGTATDQSLYGTPSAGNIDDNTNTIECSSPRIGALVSGECIRQATRLDRDQSLSESHSPYLTPVTSRKPRSSSDDPHTPVTSRSQCGTALDQLDQYLGMYVMKTEQDAEGTTYHIIRSPNPDYPGSRPAPEIFRIVSSAISAAFLTRRRFHLAGAFTGIPYFEADRGILSRRRLPRVQIKFHTRVNALLTYGHYIHQKELQCSLVDCLD